VKSLEKTLGKSMQGTDTDWSELEKQVAQQVFQEAYKRETQALVTEISQKASLVTEIQDIWGLHDYLSAKRHDIDGKYDFDYSALIFVFAKLVKEKWLSLDDLNGLETSKVAKVAALSKM
jgi:hypothetical protein